MARISSTLLVLATLFGATACGDMERVGGDSSEARVAQASLRLAPQQHVHHASANVSERLSQVITELHFTPAPGSDASPFVVLLPHDGADRAPLLIPSSGLYQVSVRMAPADTAQEELPSGLSIDGVMSTPTPKKPSLSRYFDDDRDGPNPYPFDTGKKGGEPDGGDPVEEESSSMTSLTAAAATSAPRGATTEEILIPMGTMHLTGQQSLLQVAFDAQQGWQVEVLAAELLDEARAHRFDIKLFWD